MRSRLHPLILLVSFAAFVLLIPTCYVFGALLGVPRTMRWQVAVMAAAATVVLANVVLPIIWRFVNSSTDVSTFITHYDAEKRVSISHVEAMIAAGRYDHAAEEIDALLAANGLDKGLCLLAIDLHMGKFGSSVRAEALLRRMRAESPSVWEGFATQRLIDLYMTDTNSHTKAMTELRRLIARFPGTSEASGAQACLERLRQDHRVSAV
jgi:hypothetical protein